MRKNNEQRILFAVGELNDIPTANNKIALSVAEALAEEYNCVCDVAGLDFSVPEPSSKAEMRTARLGKVTLYREDVADRFIDERARRRSGYLDYCKKRGLSETSPAAKGGYALLHPIRAGRVFLISSPRYNPELRNQPRRQYAELVRRLCAERHYDAIIAMYMPFDMCEWLFGADDLPPVYIYQLDPWSTHELKLPVSRSKRRRQELKAFATARHIFTTPVLLEQYRQAPYLTYTGKMTAVEFPNFVQSQPTAALSPVAFDPANVNVLYCGVLNDAYRDPGAILTSLMTRCSERVKVYLIGVCQSETAKRIATEYPERLFILPPVDNVACRAAMMNADILLNISNMLTNQVPSKLIDYFSTGKPVISVRKITNCPSRPYLERYPLAYIYDETAPCEEREAGLSRFIDEAAHTSVSADTLAELFEDCTPRHVARQIYENVEG